MSRRDGRQLDHKTLEVLRKEAVRRVVENNASPEEVIRELGFHRSNIYQWLKLYNQGGYEALNARPIPGARLLLDEARWRWLLETLLGATPRAFGQPADLWSRQWVRAVLERELGLRVSLQTVGKWLRERLEVQAVNPLGHSPASQGPVRDLEQWHPDLPPPTLGRGAELQFVATNRVKVDDGSGGPEREVTVLLASNPRGQTRFMVTREPLGPGVFCRFMEQLLQELQRPALLIAARELIQPASQAGPWLAERQERLQLVFRPASRRRRRLTDPRERQPQAPRELS